MKNNILIFLQIFLFGHAIGQALAPPIDFESGTVSYTFTDFDGGAATVIGNPQAGGINTSAKVAQMVKNPGEVWGGSLLTMTNPLDFSVNKLFKVKVFSPRVGARLLLKVEDPSNNAVFFEKEDTSTVANAWEELSFDYSIINTGNTYQKIVFIWDLAVMGDGSSNFTFLFDDIQLVSAGGPALAQIDLPVTFEDTTVNYTMSDFGGNASTVEPDFGNPSNTLAKVVKGINAVAWSGTTISTLSGLASPIPFSAGNTTLSMRIWSPDAGIPVRLKAEDKSDPNISVETETLTTLAGAWETLEFDFSNEVSGTQALNFASTYDLLSVFFNFGTDGATAGEKIYYFDDVMVVTATALEAPEIADLSWYPNPTAGKLTVNATNLLQFVRVYDLRGKLMLTETVSGRSADLDLRSLESGVYWMQVNTATETSGFRIVKR